ncbi:MAG: hypothetical protein Q4B70_18290 [Lachnospiraceae bacterium]|nr:hypothetical protein [Lachnospiraceae bacterium]
MLEQSNRLLVFQTLLFVALYSILPILLDNFKSKAMITWIFTVIISFVVLLSLIATLFSQWRYKYITFPRANDIKQYADDCKEEISILSTQYNYKILQIEKMLFSLQRNNDKRGKLIIVSMCLVFAAFIITIIFAYSLMIF